VRWVFKHFISAEPHRYEDLASGHASHPNRETQMNLYEVNSSPLAPSSHNHLCRGISLGLYAPGLGGLVSLDGPLALADGRGAGNGVLAEVGAVVALGGGVDDGGEGPMRHQRLFI
jgi:hypothetical protein